MSELINYKDALKHVKVMLVQNQALAKMANVLESLVQGEQLVVELGSKVEFLTKECKQCEADLEFGKKELSEMKTFSEHTGKMLKDKLAGELATNEQIVKDAEYAAAEVVQTLADQTEKANQAHADNMAKLDEALQERKAQLEKVKQDYEEFKSRF